MPVIYGNSIDIANAKTVFGENNGYTYVYTDKGGNTNNITADDIVLGGTGADYAIADSKLNGAVRLFGADRKATLEAVKNYANSHHPEIETSTVSPTIKTEYVEVRIPQPPKLVRNTPFNQPMPTFSSDVETINKYSYFFGIDSIKISNRTMHNTACFISDDIDISTNTLNNTDYIQLKAKYYTNEFSSVEFYIIDNGASIPILPIDDKMVEDEKIFYGLLPRFVVDSTVTPVIKKDGFIITSTIDKVTTLNDALYTVTYKAVNPYNYYPKSNSIKVKVIIRNYDPSKKTPYVSQIEIRKYGGDTLWQTT